MFTKETHDKLQNAQNSLESQIFALPMKLEVFMHDVLEVELKELLRKSLAESIPVVNSFLDAAKKQSEVERTNIKFPIWDINADQVIDSLSISLLEYTLLEYGDPYYGVPPLQTFSKVNRQIISTFSE